ncbi:MAG: hypothetical protein HY928_09855 [Elusimicrobia bacterium]|nr:hypothetical protein [Elusimicrobiota bacterium]
MTRAFLWGKTARWDGLSASGAERLCSEALRRRERAAARDCWTTISVLHETGRLWASPSSAWRRRAQALMPRVTGFSPAMVRSTLELIPRILERGALTARLRAELGREDALDSWRLDPDGGAALKALPLGAVLHVAAGNIFLGCIDSAVMSLLTNNATVLRTSSADPEFPLLFAESLRRADRRGALAGTLAAVSWPSGDAAVESVFKRRLQGVVVWGGEKAVSAYREDLGAGCRLVAFGPKLSFAVVSRAGLERWGVAEAARRAARDVAWWDQAACASPQTLFVEHPRPDAFLDALARELARAGRTQPPGRLSPDAAASVVEERHRALAAELCGKGRLRAGDGWTVAWRSEPALRASPLNRFLQVSPYRDLRHLRTLVEPSRPYLQTAGLLVAPEEAAAYADALSAAGAARTPELGAMLEAGGKEPHDGRYPLGELVRWVAGPAAAAADGRKALASLTAQARAESPFYRRRLARPTATTDKGDLLRHSPPASSALLTRAGEGEGRLVLASGGSTGAPKFSLYTQREFEETCRWLAFSLRQAGLGPGDTVANLFVAGNLWSSFLAVSEAAKALGVTHLPIAGTSDPAFALDALRRFKADAVIGLPSSLAALAERPEARGLTVRKVFYGGEHATEGVCRLLRLRLGARLIRSAGYASVDAGLIGFQCPRCPGSVHHAAEGLQKVEIVGGEVVATNLVRRLMPVIRYRTGDRGRWVGAPCPCGHPSPLFELLGRVDDRVNVGGAHLDAGDAARAVASVAGLSPFFQLRIDAAGGKDTLLLRAERRSGARAGLEERLAAALLGHSEELRDAVARGWLRAPAVEILPPGGLPRLPRTGKVRRVVDLRA